MRDDLVLRVFAKLFIPFMLAALGFFQAREKT